MVATSLSMVVTMRSLSSRLLASPAHPVTRHGLALKRLLWALLAIDIAFAAVHLVHAHGAWLQGPHFSIKRDGGYAERFQYLQLLALSGALLWLFARMRQFVLLAWAGVFFYLTCDDALRLHERAGLKIAESLGYASALHLRPRDLGELSVAFIVGAVTLPALLLGHAWAHGAARQIARGLGVLLAALIACGVGVDMLAVMAAGSGLSTPLALLEDGGEMVVASLALYYVLQWLMSPETEAPRQARSHSPP